MMRSQQIRMVEEVDERVFPFKHKACNWLKEAETERSAKRHTQREDQIQSALAVAERRSQVIVVAEVDAQGKEPWRKKAKLAELMAEA